MVVALDEESVVLSLVIGATLVVGVIYVVLLDPFVLGATVVLFWNKVVEFIVMFSVAICVVTTTTGVVCLSVVGIGSAVVLFSSGLFLSEGVVETAENRTSDVMFVQ